MFRCWARECKLGWGYNPDLNLLIPVQGEPPNVASGVGNEWIYSFRPAGLSSIDGFHQGDMSLLLEPSYKKFLDFQIVFNHNQYWVVRCLFRKRYQTCEKLPNYPPNCTGFVNRIDYGVELWVRFPKAEFPKDNDGVYHLFQNRNFNETQKKVKCKVLINYNEIREITLEELSQFMDEIKEGKHSQYDIPIYFEYRQLNWKSELSSLLTEIRFAPFLSSLYYLYRKIEIKLKNAEYPDILPDPNSNEESFMKISINLDKAKEEYKSMNKTDFLEMYPVVKKLFFSYIDYVKYSIEHMNSMDEENNLPGTFGEIIYFLEKLNLWSLVKVDNRWHSDTTQC